MQINCINSINILNKFYSQKTKPHNIFKENNIDKVCFSGTNNFKFLTSEKLSMTDTENKKIIWELDHEAFKDLIDFENYDFFWEYIKSKNISTYMVKDANKNLIGYYQIYMLPYQKNMYIETINLKPEYRGKHTGFSKHIFSEITNLAKEYGATKLSLNVDTQNEKAINLYKRNGFNIKDLYEEFYDTNDAYYMEKDILPTS